MILEYPFFVGYISLFQRPRSPMSSGLPSLHWRYLHYIEAMKKDIQEWIDDNVNIKDYEDRDELEEYLRDTLWTEDTHN